MIDEIIHYVQSFLILFLLIKVLLFLIPRSTFEKYISFFAGVILAIGILKPLFLFFDKEEVWDKNLYAATFKMEALEVSANVKNISDRNEIVYNKQMELLVESEIKSQLQLAGIELKGIEISLDKDYEVDWVRIVILEENEEEKARLLECLEEYHLSEAQYEIVYE